MPVECVGGLLVWDHSLHLNQAHKKQPYQHGGMVEQATWNQVLNCHCWTVFWDFILECSTLWKHNFYILYVNTYLVRPRSFINSSPWFMWFIEDPIFQVQVGYTTLPKISCSQTIQESVIKVNSLVSHFLKSSKHELLWDKIFVQQILTYL